MGSVGSKLLLIDVIPSYAYVDGREQARLQDISISLFLRKISLIGLAFVLTVINRLTILLTATAVFMYALIILNYRCIGQVQDIRLRQRQVLFI